MDVSDPFFHRKEGNTQGYTLDTIAHGRGILILICELHAAQPHIMQPWYDDDAGTGENLTTLQ